MAIRIVVLNPKGGSGKTTIATNLAAFYASHGLFPALQDLDAQASSTRWLAKRSEAMPRIHGVSPFNVPANVTRTFAMRIPPEVERIVVDTPAAVSKQQFAEFTRGADRIVVPVLPSDIDIQAVTRCIADLLLHTKIQRSDNRIAVVANRVKRNTLIFGSLMRFLDSLKIPIVAVLRDSQHYVRAAESGVGLHEMKGARPRVDQAHWLTLLDWIEHGVIPPPDAPWSEPRATEADDGDVGERAVTPEATDDDDAAEPSATPATDAPLRLVDVSGFIKRDS